MVMALEELIAEIASDVEKQTACFCSYPWQLSLKVI